MENYIDEYDIIIIGAGHAGIESSLASVRLGKKAALFTISLDGIGNLPCNPSIGGTAKGHLVREVDALGGEMGKVADKTFIQSRMLNKGKGPAVHSLRAQVDRTAYHLEIKKILENTPNLDIIQMEVTKLLRDKQNNIIEGIETSLGCRYRGKAVIICSGTYLKSLIYVGDKTIKSGPDGMLSAEVLSSSLQEMGIDLRRFKTGTPARIHRDSVDFSRMEEQKGDESIVPFSFETDEKGLENKVSCHIAYTNTTTHDIIKKNINRSAMYGGMIEGVGPRYCPSIEDKVMRFADKERHQTFIEPMGLDTQEMYVQGVSSSLPIDVQIDLYRSIEGMENVKIMRNAYAIEYDCINPLDLKPTLEFKKIKGLYGAGQFNGTSGYEEAAAQGLVAGINAVRMIDGESEFVLDRASSYIGTLIDDLVTKGCSDPYRMMTSRSEYRLLLRQDNADRRLTPLGRQVGLISDERWKDYQIKQDQIDKEIKRMKKLTFGKNQELNHMLVSRETPPIENGACAEDLIKRPQIGYHDLAPFDKDRQDLPRSVAEQVEIEIKYEGYIKRQIMQVGQMRKLENKRLPKDLDYNNISGLRLEAREKLAQVMPENIGQASRVSGVSPADVSMLLIYIESI